ncbi:DUF6861 domain-containing protein [Pseudomonas syringae]|uniref:Glycine zipper family protein n=3 Tax=Pseudomonas syringae TaxID=317 RepID=A0AB35JXF7_PSESY|nr:glycine zipper family protein [Pseudomonas syringae]MBI6772895.1 glycine zipper family protein [Pseudomonas syringae]MBI6792609.1 glycine zipper family protein [Pseudomonas syringae]MBI6799882.1 glycine zipper family protein [Pseudomonas syringae]MBI6833997.1 glycine zipper family protein [Pseudomonas syringae]MDC3738053.1 glycine zipper family protein [Pseudomonas syringae pv. syringae]
MDLLANVPKWDDIERNLEDKFSHLNQSFDQGWESASDGWHGFTRRVSNEATLAFGSIGGNRIDSVKLAMARSYPIIQLDLMRKWASIDITEILPVLLQLVKEVAMIMGGSVAVGTIMGAAAGSLAFGAGSVPGAIVGSGIGAQVGNLILLGMGLSAIATYFYEGLPACLTTIYEGMVTAWNAEEGVKPAGLDPSGASAWLIDERIDAAAQKLAKGQEQLIMLLLTAIVTYITRGQIKSGITGSLDSIAARSAKLQADMTNKQIAGWLARNEQKLLAHPDLRPSEAATVAKKESEILTPNKSETSTPKEPEKRDRIDKEDEFSYNRNPVLGVLENSVFAQKISKPTKTFSKVGQNLYSRAAGHPIDTVADLTSALEKGTIKPSQVPLDYVIIDGQNVIANTRSSTALINAGIPKSQWYGANKTGVTAYDQITFDDLVRDQLRKNYGGSVLNARK